MNLIIDAGNTVVKLAVFKSNTLIKLSKCDLKNIDEEILKIRTSYSGIEKVITSSVSSLDENSLKVPLKGLSCYFLNHQTSVPFINLYATPTTLGVDRIALVAGAVSQFPDENVLVIDAGTCITYDIVNEKTEYLGGSIAPGLQMRYKSLADYTENLPLLNPKFPEKRIGDSTENAIHAGVSNGLIAEINGVISDFSNNYKSLVVILTGGDANFLSKRLKSSIFVDPNFLIHGLNYIIEHTIDK